jgi:hypothetical protein
MQSDFEMATLIQETDPLAPRLPSEERVRRALNAFDRSLTRLDECLAARGASSATTPQQPELEQLNASAATLRPKVSERNLARDPDLLLKVTDMAFDIERVSERACGEPKGEDLALLLLSRAQEGRTE